MKTPIKNTSLFTLFLIAVIAATGPAVFASGEKPDSLAPVAQEPPAGQEDELTARDLAALERFLTMSDEELDRLQAALARIRAMSEEERRQFAGRVVEYRRLPRDERQREREGWGWREDRDREDWRRMMQDLDPTERRKVHESLQDLSPEERIERRMELIEKWRARQ